MKLNVPKEPASPKDLAKEFQTSDEGKKYFTGTTPTRYDCKTITRAFVAWAKSKNIRVRVLLLAPPSAATLAQFPRLKNDVGEGDSHIMPVVAVNGQDVTIDFTVHQFPNQSSSSVPRITRLSDVSRIYKAIGGYYTDRPKWMNSRSDWLGTWDQLSFPWFSKNFTDEIHTKL